MPEPHEPDRPRRGCGMCCAWSFGAAMLAVLALALWLARPDEPIRVPPAPAPPSPNGFADFMAAHALYRAAGGDGPVAAVGGTQSAAGTPARAAYDARLLAAETAVVAANGPALARLRLGLARECLAPPDRGTGLEYLTSIRELARLLSYEAHVRAARGDYAGSARSAADAMLLGARMTRGADAIGTLVGWACADIGRRPALAAVDQLSPSECDAMAARIERISDRCEPMSAMLRAELRANLLEAKRIDDDPARGLAGGVDPAPPLSPLARIAARVAWRSQRHAFLEQTHAYYDAWMRQADIPAPQRKAVPKPTGTLASLALLDVPRVLRKGDIFAARDRMVVCALHIRAYQLAHGALPASLGLLGLPRPFSTDPFSAGPLVYRPQGHSYLLYSVGPDGKDDGGVPADETATAPKGDVGLSFYAVTRGAAVRPSPPHMLPYRPL